MGDFEQQFPAIASWKKKIACNKNVKEKNDWVAVRKKKKYDAKLFHHSGVKT